MSKTSTGLLAITIVGGLFALISIFVGFVAFGTSKDGKQLIRQISAPSESIEGERWTIDDVASHVRTQKMPALVQFDSGYGEFGQYKTFLNRGQDGGGFTLWRVKSKAEAENVASFATNGWAWGRFVFSFSINSDKKSANMVLDCFSPGTTFEHMSPTLSESLQKMSDDIKRKAQKDKK